MFGAARAFSRSFLSKIVVVVVVVIVIVNGAIIIIIVVVVMRQGGYGKVDNNLARHFQEAIPNPSIHLDVRVDRSIHKVLHSS